MDILLKDMGILDYGECLGLMLDEHKRIVASLASPCIWMVQHPNVVTMGNRKLVQDLRFDAARVAQAGASKTPFSYFEVDRGGSATAHEPGQLVVYPMLPLVLFPKGVRGLVEFLEECVIQTSLSFGVVAGRDPINAGVWCNDRKIAAVGLRVKEHVTLHGLAFNLVNSLETFGHIIPCGLASRGVTSLSLEFYHEKKKCSDWMPERNLTFEQGSQVFVAKMKELLPLYGAASLDSQKTQLSQSRVSSSATL